jgi:ATP adenylyltransferase
LRFCLSIGKKPKPSGPHDEKKSVDPFLEPPEALFLIDVGQPATHFLVLNKFAIVPGHFILATKAFKEQTHLLEEDDLAVTFACLQAWRKCGLDLFAFFNSGEHSGASQPHR